MGGEITTRGVMIAIPLLKNNTNHFGSLGTKVENGNPFLLTYTSNLVPYKIVFYIHSVCYHLQTHFLGLFL